MYCPVVAASFDFVYYFLVYIVDVVCVIILKTVHNVLSWDIHGLAGTRVVTMVEITG